VGLASGAVPVQTALRSSPVRTGAHETCLGLVVLSTHPDGQQAGLLLLSRAQVCPVLQQTSLNAAPSEVGHWNILAGHSALRMREAAVAASGPNVGSGMNAAALNVA
jgi:hypothetical protein